MPWYQFSIAHLLLLTFVVAVAITAAPFIVPGAAALWGLHPLALVGYTAAILAAAVFLVRLFR